MRILLILAVSLITFLQEATGQHNSSDSTQSTANEYMHQSSHEELAKIFDSSERDSWQKPDLVINFLGDISGKTVVDVGSGSGYFSFRLVEAGANVIAADVDPDFLRMIKEKQEKYNIEQGRLTTKLIENSELNINSNSADIVFLVNVYHHISDRVEYFSNVNSKLKQDGKIVIVDFYKKTLPIGPSKSHKISKEIVLKELDTAGFQKIDVNIELLEYQYIITAYKY